MAELASDPRVVVVKGAMCAWSMMDVDIHEVPGYVRKHTGWLTNSRCIAAAVARECPGDHRHFTLLEVDAQRVPESTRQDWSWQF